MDYSIIKTPIINVNEDNLWSIKHEEWAKPGDILVITPTQIIGTQDAVFLQKMFEACKKNWDELVLYSVGQQEIPWRWLAQNIKPKYVFLFGVDPSALHINAHLHKNQVNQFDQTQFIIVDALQDLATQPQLKQFLWTSILKPLFLV
jgi:hypothetical protein